MEINIKTRRLFKSLFHKLDLNGYSDNLDLARINSEYQLIEADDMDILKDETGKLNRIDIINLRVEYKGMETGHRRINAKCLWWYLEHIYIAQHYEIFNGSVLIDIFTDPKYLKHVEPYLTVKRFHKNKEII